MTPIAKQVVCLGERDAELRRAWRTFADAVERHPLSGEIWHYLCSASDEEAGWLHCFRHRHHPVSNRREYRFIAAADGWSPTVTDEESGKIVSQFEK